MKLQRIEFGSLLSYCPHKSDEKRFNDARNYMQFVKDDSVIKAGSDVKRMPMSQWTANAVSKKMDQLPFNHFFKADSAFVPVPRSSLQVKDALWVPDRVAVALEAKGLGKRVQLLQRAYPVNRSSTSKPSDRPLPKVHYDSLRVTKAFDEFSDIVLVDDVITRGHTILGAAWRLGDMYPDVKVVAFAAVRTVSNPSEFKNWYDPVKGEVNYREQYGDTIRRP